MLNKSFSRPKENNTAAYAPKVTLGAPRSMARKVVREMPARSEMRAAENFRRNLARRIFSPVSAKILCNFGKTLFFSLGIMVNTLSKIGVIGYSINHYRAWEAGVKGANLHWSPRKITILVRSNNH
jgi:hypothetical protein